jgi:hypothetical protein
MQSRRDPVQSPLSARLELPPVRETPIQAGSALLAETRQPVQAEQEHRDSHRRVDVLVACAQSHQEGSKGFSWLPLSLIEYMMWGIPMFTGVPLRSSAPALRHLHLPLRRRRPRRRRESAISCMLFGEAGRLAFSPRGRNARNRRMMFTANLRAFTLFERQRSTFGLLAATT